MRVLVFGASGATGRELVAQALAQGQRVTAFVRNVSRLAVRSEDVSVLQGDVMDASAVSRAVEGQDAVLCALGAATPLRRDLTLVEGVRNIVDAMKRCGAPRFVYLVSGGPGRKETTELRRQGYHRAAAAA